MVREQETELYEKQLKEIGRFILKKKRLTKKYYRDHSFQILEKILHRLGSRHALPTGASEDKGRCAGDTGRISEGTGQSQKEWRSLEADSKPHVSGAALVEAVSQGSQRGSSRVSQRPHGHHTSLPVLLPPRCFRGFPWQFSSIYIYMYMSVSHEQVSILSP